MRVFALVLLCGACTGGDGDPVNGADTAITVGDTGGQTAGETGADTDPDARLADDGYPGGSTRTRRSPTSSLSGTVHDEGNEGTCPAS